MGSSMATLAAKSMAARRWAGATPEQRSEAGRKRVAKRWSKPATTDPARQLSPLLQAVAAWELTASPADIGAILDWIKSE